jgi:hypothetical protein
MDTSPSKPQQSPKAPPAPQSKAQVAQASVAVAAPAQPARDTVRVRVKAGAAIATASGRKVGGDWIDLDVRDMKIPNLRRFVETEEDIAEAEKPARQRAEQQAATHAMFQRFVESDVRAAEREKAIRKPLLDAMTPQGTAPAPARIG